MTRSIRFIIGAQTLITTVVGCAAFASAADSPPAPPWESPLARDAALTGQIRDPKTGARLTPAQLLDRLADADFVLLGERHDNPDHHRLQAWIIERLLDPGRRMAVAFEMIDRGQASRLARYLDASPEDAAGLGAALDWDRSGWPAWRHYQPIAAAAMTRRLPIVAANLPRSLARAVARDGITALPLPFAKRLQIDSLWSRSEAKPILNAQAADMQAAHCGQLPEHHVKRFAQAQFARDAHMARAMIDVWRISNGTMGAILIAGGEHARADRGVPWHLAHTAPGARTIALGFVEADEIQNERDLASQPYDLVWFTAGTAREDMCADFRLRP